MILAELAKEADDQEEPAQRQCHALMLATVLCVYIGDDRFIAVTRCGSTLYLRTRDFFEPGFFARMSPRKRQKWDTNFAEAVAASKARPARHPTPTNCGAGLRFRDKRSRENIKLSLIEARSRVYLLP